VEAYDYYLRGKQYFHGSRRKSMEFALDMYRRAADRDPDYALAYAGIANCYCYRYMHFGGAASDLQHADQAAGKALQLDPNLAEAHAARGFCLALDKQTAAAEAAFEKAIQLNSGLWEAYYFYARMCYSAGQFEKAARMFEKACRADPKDYQATSLLGMTYRTLGLDQQARDIYRQTVANVERHVELNPDDSRAIYLGAQALIELGRKDEGWRWACRALEIDPDDSSIVYGMACICCRVGKLDQALDHLEKAVELGFHHREWIENDTDLAELRKLPRFAAILAMLDTNARTEPN
jgi:tetratricopeptide (TPR) repeat protein